MIRPRSLTPAQASAALGLSAKALRLYERHGLLDTGRTRAGWRLYDDDALARAAAIAALRRLGFGLSAVGSLIAAPPSALEAALARQEAHFDDRRRRVAAVLDRLRSRRAATEDRRPAAAYGVATDSLAVTMALPWPWDGELFTLADMPRLGFITGPLGSGKTRFAQALAAALPNAVFVGLERGRLPSAPRRSGHAALAPAVAARIDALVADGAQRSPALVGLIETMEAAAGAVLVVDMVEDGLDPATQAALMAHLRRGDAHHRALMLMTRSSVILDLAALRADELVLLCPANHGLPLRVVPRPGGLGYEAAATCLATPEVRARTAGVIARRP